MATTTGVSENGETLNWPETTYTISGLTNPSTEFLLSVRGVDTVAEGSTTGSTAAASVTECIAPKAKTKKKDKEVEEVAPEPTPRPPANTCLHLPLEYEIYGYAAYNTQCQVVGAAGIGRADVIQQGVIGAVDIWGIVPGGGVDVCIHGHGSMVFLDAAFSPRLLVDPGSEIREGMTCTRIDRAGTVVLVVSVPGGASMRMDAA